MSQKNSNAPRWKIIRKVLKSVGIWNEITYMASTNFVISVNGQGVL